ncbi:hypothetical protein [Tunicatimonas pelagia]|uniref:hypothetical protein n=1 Tax=Tunicatimonas pelagia TaxID=931531 RepID=UPI002665E41D|nr:hypothetical protein [Tunicatimonas pelagia]WKN43174.1 hypothetical protein P0M28_29465 [Tunicatimonas pelagia]
MACKAHNNYDADSVVSDVAAFTKNKSIPDEMRSVIIAALSQYPDLVDTRIEFRYEDEIRKSVMQAQPKVMSLLRGKSKRAYIIKISRYLELNNKNLDISTLPFEVLVGWIAHELGHIMDYHDRSGLAMMSFGIKYWLSEKYLKKAERRADMYALRHGLGDEVVKTKKFILNHAEIPNWYKARIKRLYMSPKEYSQLISEDTTAP